MKDVTQQAILTLSKEIQTAAAHAVGTATFARFYDGRILRLVDDGVYRVALGDQVVNLKVYGNGVFEYGQHVYVISPNNSKELSKMFILGLGGPGGDGDSEDHEILMQLIKDVDAKLDVGVVVQEKGQSETNVMSQKAVTDLIDTLSFDGIQGVVLGSTVLEPNPANNHVTIPIADVATLGVVLSKSQKNGVVVDKTGAMTVESLDLMRVDQASDNTLILDGGHASTWLE